MTFYIPEVMCAAKDVEHGGNQMISIFEFLLHWS